MPYIKRDTNNAVIGAYEVERIDISLTEAKINIVMRRTYLDANGIPRSDYLYTEIKDTNQFIIDSAWLPESDSNYDPNAYLFPRPEGFNENDANTWGGINPSDFPRILDESKQHFTITVSRDADGANLYERIRAQIYNTLQVTGEIPPESDGWSIE